MKHVMLDLETAGRAPNGAIIAIGAVCFNAAGVLDTFAAQLDFTQSVRDGGTIDPDTIKWWLEQDSAVRTRMFGGKEEPAAALRRFFSWYEGTGAKRIWANGTTFDMPILETAFVRAGLNPPYRYKDVRDMRWLRDIVPIKLFEPIYAANPAVHDAVEDAIVQANIVRVAAAHLGVQL